MVTFANPMLLLLLISVAIFALLYWYSRYRRRRLLARFGKPELLASLMPDASKYLPAVKITLILAAICSLVIVLARPRTRGKVVEEEVNGIEVMIAVDVSNSMRASSTDAPRGVARLDRAKHILRTLLSRLNNDRVGLIVFAGDAFTQLPLTPDFISAKMYVDEISTGMVDNQGTDIGAAIQLAMNSFSGEPDVNRAMIVITDAEDQIGDALTAAKAAKEEGIQVDVVGLGSAKGAQIPLDNTYKNFLKDDEGKVVTTYLNEELAQSVAEAGGGVYVNGASSSAISTLVDHLGEIKTASLGKVNYSTADEQFPIFAWIAFVLILLDCILSNRKIGFLRKYNFFTRSGKCVALLMVCGLGANAQALMPPVDPAEDSSTRQERRYIREGNEAFNSGNYGDAEILYRRALNDNPQSEAAQYNLALTLLNLEPEASAPQQGEQADKESPAAAGRQAMAGLLNAADAQIAEYAAYNLGNLAFAGQELQQALNLYKQALRKNPTNENARQNMRYVQKLLEQQQNQQNQDQQNQNQDNQDQQQQQQQQQQNQDQNKDENKDNQDQQQQNQQNQDKQQQQQQQEQQSGMSKQNREQILNAVESKDANARGKMKKNQGKNGGHTRQRGKNW